MKWTDDKGTELHLDKRTDREGLHLKLTRGQVGITIDLTYDQVWRLADELKALVTINQARIDIRNEIEKIDKKRIEERREK